jgi:hypothetical protein
MYNGLSLAESTDTPDYIISDSQVDVSVSLNKTELSINEKLTVAFSFPGKPKTWYYKSDSMEVIYERATDGEISIDIIPGIGAGRFSFYVDLGCGVQKETVYTYAECGKVFATTVSEDTAWLDNLKYRLDSGIITEREASEARGAYT